MLRPATPLSILLFISFVLLLLSVISTPIVRGIPIARYQGYNFGVFGYCQDGGPCSKLEVGYTTDGLFTGQNDFNLASGTRHALSSLLIVHPVAALCNLIVLALAVAAHFHSPSHSARYLLGLLILLLPTLLITLLAFLVDILLFVPHLTWGGWIVLASTILITSSGVVTCGMRRTLVSRKARKRRIAENAEMNGENYYARQEHEAKMAGVSTIAAESKSPIVHGGPGADNLPAFASYPASQRSEERQQINHVDMAPVSPINEENRFYANGPRSSSRPRRSEENNTPSGPMDPHAPPAQFRPPPDARSPALYPPSAYGMRGSYGPPRARGSGPPRGGFAPRGGYPPRGGMPPQAYGRGGYGPDPRGGYGGRGRGGFSGGSPMAGVVVNRRPPPPGYPPQDSGSSPERYGAPQAFSSDPRPYSQGSGAKYDHVSPSQYTTGDEHAATYVAYSSQSRTPSKAGSYGSRGQSPVASPRSVSPPPAVPVIGQVIEMDATNGRASGYDSDVQGMVDLQRRPRSPVSPLRDHSQGYVPPRDEWNDGIPDAPAHHAVTVPVSSANRTRASSHASGSYYEDVDPRFAESADAVSALPQRNVNVQHQVQPLLSAPYGGQHSGGPSDRPHLAHSASYEELPVGARSPSESETSHFTSVSQRGVNPNWRPGHGGEFNNLGPQRSQQPRQEVLLANNPDFELVPPPARFGGRGGRAAFRGGGGGMGRMPPPSAMLMNGDSPYPGPSTMREI